MSGVKALDWGGTVNHQQASTNQMDLADWD